MHSTNYKDHFLNKIIHFLGPLLVLNQFQLDSLVAFCLKTGQHGVYTKQTPSMRPFALLQKGSSNFWVCEWNLKYAMRTSENNFLWYYLQRCKYMEH